MLRLVRRYTHWLHTQWPAGTVEKLPVVDEHGRTNVPGVYVTGDLTGIPLLKFSAHTGTRAVRHICSDPAFLKSREEGRLREEPPLDLVIIGAGVSGMAAALEAENRGLNTRIYEANEPFSTIVNFPRAKPIYTYPTEMTPDGDLQFHAEVKEPLLDELRAQTRHIHPVPQHVEQIARKNGLLELTIGNEPAVRALRVIVAIGRSGNFRTLDVPGESLDKVYNRLHDPRDYAGKEVLVVGGGDSALESAVALASCGAGVTLSYRRKEFSRPKPENVERLEALLRDPMAEVEIEEPVSERITTATGGFMGGIRQPGHITLMMGSRLKSIADREVTITRADGREVVLPNDAVFSMIGREAPLDFFRRSGVKLHGETRGREWLALALFFLLIVLVYDWKNDGFLSHQVPALARPDVFPANMPSVIASWGEGWAAGIADRSTVAGTLAVSMKSRSFYYTLVYTLCILGFGIARIRRRRTPYVTMQTSVLFLVQFIPLSLLPELILPLMGYNGLFDSGWGRTIADALFERYIPEAQYLAHSWPAWGHPRAYWRAYGLILAWPLMVYNVFTPEPIWGWLALSVVQTFVLIPGMIYYWGKGAYCGWICSCGGLAETMGDGVRHKMPHGPFWNRFNMVGQAVLAVAFLLLGVRALGWIFPESPAAKYFPLLLEGKNAAGGLANPLSYKWTVDVLMGGILGVGLYFKYSGRVWCRFMCPLAALMHIYARFSRFRIVPEKKKCISCNVCTSVCHQGIDIMNFANKGIPMSDPQCVRCSACVQMCPTGVLQFGQVDARSGRVIRLDRLPASPVLMAERP